MKTPGADDGDLHILKGAKGYDVWQHGKVIRSFRTLEKATEYGIGASMADGCFVLLPSDDSAASVVEQLTLKGM